MESAQLLDILGNENRRKILHLLASKPCYMSEIAERLDVGAKAILGHLLLLEKAGLIEASVDDQRRKYFHIMDNLRLEVFVSPYSFEVATTMIEVREPIEHSAGHVLSDLKSLYGKIQEMIETRQKILQEYQEIQADIADALGRSMEVIENIVDENIEAEILYALLKGQMTSRALSIQLGIPEYVLEKYLSRMDSKKLIKEDENSYSID
ncbi:MAG: ArsR family transcriptional regulator [Candidatus Methanoperedens sp.]|nr:ArsR family transcriptional regulator [Candidatus Methanoperedens sp.]